MEHVEVIRLDDGWGWSFSDGNGARVVSNLTYADAARAEDAARRAYPDLDVIMIDGQSDAESDAPESTARRIAPALLVVLLVTLGIALWWWTAHRDELMDKKVG